jgi:replicative DNA helicase
MNRLEQTILKNLIYNDEYARKVLPFIRPDYFADNAEKLVFKEVFDFIDKYKNLPTHEALVINFTEKKNLTEPDVRSSIELLNDIHTNKDEPLSLIHI